MLYCRIWQTLLRLPWRPLWKLSMWRLVWSVPQTALYMSDRCHLSDCDLYAWRERFGGTVYADEFFHSVLLCFTWQRCHVLSVGISRWLTKEPLHCRQIHHRLWRGGWHGVRLHNTLLFHIWEIWAPKGRFMRCTLWNDSITHFIMITFMICCHLKKKKKLVCLYLKKIINIHLLHE